VKELEDAGWTRKPGRKHVKMLAPSGAGMMVVALTPSDRRALTNMRALAKRLERI
jgi:hypothetical protein